MKNNIAVVIPTTAGPKPKKPKKNKHTQIHTVSDIQCWMAL